jgi:hypothetical protein
VKLKRPYEAAAVHHFSNQGLIGGKHDVKLLVEYELTLENAFLVLVSQLKSQLI